MSTWECRGCTAAYSVGAPRCPQCSANDPIDEHEQLARENEMPKITVHGGASNADDGADEVEAAAATDETEQAAAAAEEKPADDAKTEKTVPEPKPSSRSRK